MSRFSLVALVASIAINAAALAVMGAGINQSSLPRGQVTVSEIVTADTPVYARAEGEEVRKAVAL